MQRSCQSTSVRTSSARVSIPFGSSPEPERWWTLIHRAALSLALDLPEGRIDQLVGYLNLLVRWNATYNLTAVRDPEQMVHQHLADCLACIKPLIREAEAKPRTRVLDVGSGGGLPGAIIAIAWPESEVTCIDTVGKKTAFISQVAGTLALRNLSARHGRVENHTSEGFDVITSRAFSSLPKFVELTSRQLLPGGKWMAMKGATPLSEIAGVPEGVDVFHVEPLTVPGLVADRCLVWMRHK